MKNNKLLLISIKEKYVNQIISGQKTIELRKAKPKVKAGDTVIIYTTQPKKAVTAIATVKQIITLHPDVMWREQKDKLGIDYKDYKNYYQNANLAVGIELGEVIQLDAEILLSAIKMIQPGFTPPQTFKYLDRFQALRNFTTINKGLRE